MNVLPRPRGSSSRRSASLRGALAPVYKPEATVRHTYEEGRTTRNGKRREEFRVSAEKVSRPVELGPSQFRVPSARVHARTPVRGSPTVCM